MNKFVKITSVVLCIAMLVTLTVLTACDGNKINTPDDTTAPVEDVKNILSVALATDKKPYSFHKDDKVVGVNVDLMANFATSLNMDLELKDVSDEALVSGLLAGDYKLAIVDFEITDLDTLKQVSVSNPIISDVESVLVLAGAPINKVADLIGKVVGVLADHAAEKLAADRFGADNVKSYATVEELVAALVAGDVAGMISDDEVIAEARMLESNLIPLVDDLYNHSYYVCALNTNSTLINSINAHIGTLSKDSLNMYLSQYTEEGSSETSAE